MLTRVPNTHRYTQTQIHDHLLTTVRVYKLYLLTYIYLPWNGWLGSRVVSVLDSGAVGPGFNRSRDAVG